MYSNSYSEHDVGRILIQAARSAISTVFGKTDAHLSEDFSWLHESGASFVTLMQGEMLRGCIGTLKPYRPLLNDVQSNAQAAAFRDSRFLPLAEPELEHTLIEISLLSPMQLIVFTDEQDALAQLQPGIDGVVFEFGHYRSTFLPQVWDQLTNPTLFMEHLKNKAGLNQKFWNNEVKLFRYSVKKWKERDI